MFDDSYPAEKLNLFKCLEDRKTKEQKLGKYVSIVHRRHNIEFPL